MRTRLHRSEVMAQLGKLRRGHEIDVPLAAIEAELGYPLAEANMDEIRGVIAGLSAVVKSLNDDPLPLRGQVAELRAEIKAWESGKGMGQLAIDPPSPSSPRVLSADAEDADWWLQQTCNGIPVWVCACCITLTLGAPKPAVCVGCGEPDLGEALYSGVLIEQDNPDVLTTE